MAIKRDLRVVPGAICALALAIHPLYRVRQNVACRVQTRQAVLKAVKVQALRLGQQEALGVALGDDLFPDVHRQFAQACDAGLELRQFEHGSLSGRDKWNLLASVRSLRLDR